jgi:hypothetical protein
MEDTAVWSKHTGESNTDESAFDPHSVDRQTLRTIYFGLYGGSPMQKDGLHFGDSGC